LFRGRIKVMLTIALHSTLYISETVGPTASLGYNPKDHHIRDDIWGIKWSRDWRHVTPKVMWGSTIGYLSDSWASCYVYWRRRVYFMQYTEPFQITDS